MFVLSDLDLVCLEGKDALASRSAEVWDKMAIYLSVCIKLAGTTITQIMNNLDVVAGFPQNW